MRDRDHGDAPKPAGSAEEPPVVPQQVPDPSAHRTRKSRLKLVVMPTLLLGAGAVTMDVTTAMFLAPGLTLMVGFLGLGLGFVLFPTSNLLGGLALIFGPIYWFGTLWMILAVLDALRLPVIPGLVLLAFLYYVVDRIFQHRRSARWASRG